ncbi:hypothetical protein B0H21DRAFT_712657 [Amylocystis lapponica]|nr:hypothetical protein B0H21DRAFT_712657 [Amylocystis lapponica]
MNMVQPYPVHIPVHAPPPPNPPPNQQVVAAPMHANAPGRVCQWDGGICKVPIHDPTPRGVETHLRNYHFHNTPGRPWHRANRVACMCISHPPPRKAGRRLSSDIVEIMMVA